MPTTAHDTPARQKRRILLNATDMLAPSHLNFGQWRRPEDCDIRAGDITALILDDVFGQNDTHGANSEPAIRTGCQFPIGDPTIPVAAMAAVTKSISFIVTASPFHEAPTITARRFSTIDHLTGGRFGWNVTTQLNASTARSLGLPVIDSEKVHEVASECLDVLYKLWEGSWADDALNEDVGNEIYSDPTRIRWIQHASKSFHINTPHMLDPSPQRTPFLMHTGATAIDFAAKHAEAITLSALSPHTLAPRVIALRHAAARHGRDPRCLKIFAMLAPILGSTDAEAQAKFARAMGFTSIEGGLVFYSSVTGVNFSQLSLDNETSGGGNNDVFVGGTSRTPKWTPQNLGKLMAVGGNGAVAVGSAQRVADTMEEWVQIADIDGFNISAVVTPGSFEDVVDLLVPELQLRGLYPKRQENGTLRERVYGMGQKYLRNDHYGSTLKFTDS